MIQPAHSTIAVANKEVGDEMFTENVEQGRLAKWQKKAYNTGRQGLALIAGSECFDTNFHDPLNLPGHFKPARTHEMVKRDGHIPDAPESARPAGGFTQEFSSSLEISNPIV